MSKKTITICDACGKELTGRLTFRVCPCCQADICLECIDKASPIQKQKATQAHPAREGSDQKEHTTGLCPEHKVVLVQYEVEGKRMLQCPEPSCNYEVEMAG